MNHDAIAIDTSAAVDFFHPLRTTPSLLIETPEIFVPLPVIGELRFGALNAPDQSRSALLSALNSLIASSRILVPDLETTISYAAIRLQIAFPPNMSRKRETHLINDLWIAALCLQHDLPLLTNDRDFDRIEGLKVIHW